MLHKRVKKGKIDKSIIFIHGNSSSSRVFEKVIEQSELPYNLIALDLPGHGKSEHTGKYSWQEILDSIQELLNTIKGDKLLVGHSLGGHYAIELLPETPSAKGILIFGTPPLKKPLNVEEAFNFNPNAMSFYLENPKDEVLALTFNDIIKNKEVIDIVREDFVQTDSKIRVALGGELNKSPSPLNDEASIFSTALLKKYILLPKNDPLVNQMYLYQLQKEAKTTFEIFEMDNCGHYPSIENPEKFYAILKKIAHEVFNN